MGKIIVIVLGFFMGGCASVMEQTTPTFHDLDTGKATNFRTMTLIEVNAFAPTPTVQIVLKCEPKVSETALPRCRPSDVGQHNATPGVVTGFGSAVINSAAVVGGAHLIGKGLSESGDNETEDNSTNNNVEDGVIKMGETTHY